MNINPSAPKLSRRERWIARCGRKFAKMLMRQNKHAALANERERILSVASDLELDARMYAWEADRLTDIIGTEIGF